MIEIPVIISGKGLSDEFSRNFRDAVFELPAAINSFLYEQGVSLVAVTTLVAYLPELAGQRPRGWSDEAVWENVPGAALNERKLAIVAERRLSGGCWRANCNWKAVLRHEVGHLVDFLLRRFSWREQFSIAYARDIAKIPETLREQLQYYLQPGKAGPEETFAELFAILIGGGNDPASDATMREHFYQCWNVLPRLRFGLF